MGMRARGGNEFSWSVAYPGCTNLWRAGCRETRASVRRAGWGSVTLLKASTRPSPTQFVDADHHRTGRRLQIEPDQVASLASICLLRQRPCQHRHVVDTGSTRAEARRQARRSPTPHGGPATEYRRAATSCTAISVSGTPSAANHTIHGSHRGPNGAAPVAEDGGS